MTDLRSLVANRFQEWVLRISALFSVPEGQVYEIVRSVIEAKDDMKSKEKDEKIEEEI